MQARLHPGHDSGRLGDGALAAASTTSRGDMDRSADPEASNFGFSSVPLPRGLHGDGGPSPMGLPAVAYTAGRVAPAGAGRGGAIVGTCPPAKVAGVPARNAPVAGCIGPTGGGGSGGAAHVPPIWHVFGGAFGTHGSGRSGTSRRGRGPLDLCDRAQTPPPMRAGATHGDNWTRAHVPGRHQRRRWLCAPARRWGGRGRRPSRWRTCSGLADCGGYQSMAT